MDTENTMDATIVIPVKNGGKRLGEVLEAVFSQETTYRYEVICVDSGSHDDSLATIRRFPARLVQIPPTEFGHGRTRNYGASLGTGRYIVFLTQDALPADAHWLTPLLDVMESDPQVAGAFGQHLPYPDCNVFDKRDLPVHFARFGAETTIFSIEDRAAYDADINLRLFLSFFSDNNSCLRRSVWEQHPYPDVAFAEDQIWMRARLEEGWKKAYVPASRVYHSHNFGVIEYTRRLFDDLRAHYVMHDGYRMIPTVLMALRMMLGGIRADIHYVRCLPLSRPEKARNCLLGVGRDIGRSVGGYFGSNYYTYGTQVQGLLDSIFSQQARQRKA